MYSIRRRSTGKIVESGFSKREEAKPRRNELNLEVYKKKTIEDIKIKPHLVEYYVVRSNTHPKGQSM